MKRSDIYLVDLNPVIGSEADKIRPAIIVSNDIANDTARRLGRGTVTVIPVTSSTARIYPFQVLIPARTGGLTQESKAQAEQVRTVDIRRLTRRLGSLPPPLTTQVDAALRLHLGL